MKHIAMPTTKLPNGNVIVEERFLRKLVEAVNALMDEVEANENRLDAHDVEIASMKEDDQKLGNAVTKIANAVGVLIGG